MGHVPIIEGGLAPSHGMSELLMSSQQVVFTTKRVRTMPFPQRNKKWQTCWGQLQSSSFPHRCRAGFGSRINSPLLVVSVQGPFEKEALVS